MYDWRGVFDLDRELAHGDHRSELYGTVQRELSLARAAANVRARVRTVHALRASQFWAAVQHQSAGEHSAFGGGLDWGQRGPSAKTSVLAIGWVTDQSRRVHVRIAGDRVRCLGHIVRHAFEGADWINRSDVTRAGLWGLLVYPELTSFRHLIPYRKMSDFGEQRLGGWMAPAREPLDGEMCFGEKLVGPPTKWGGPNLAPFANRLSRTDWMVYADWLDDRDASPEVSAAIRAAFDPCPDPALVPQPA